MINMTNMTRTDGEWKPNLSPWVSYKNEDEKLYALTGAQEVLMLS